MNPDDKVTSQPESATVSPGRVTRLLARQLRRSKHRESRLRALLQEATRLLAAPKRERLRRRRRTASVATAPPVDPFATMVVPGAPYTFPDAKPARECASNADTLADVYTSKKGGPHLPGKSRPWMVRNAKTIPGARKVGRDWVVAHADWERWLAEQDARRCMPRARQPEAREIAAKAVASLLNMRPTKV